MATCVRCGAEILWKRLDGQPFAVDVHESSSPGDGRYVERDAMLLRTTASAEVAAFVDHRMTCAVPA